MAPALNLIWPNFCQDKNAFLRQFEPFICLTNIPQFLILHICWRNATVRYILLCSELYLSSIQYNRVTIDIPAAVCVALLINSRACSIYYVSLNWSSIDSSVRAQKVREIWVVPGSKSIIDDLPSNMCIVVNSSLSSGDVVSRCIE